MFSHVESMYKANKQLQIPAIHEEMEDLDYYLD